MSLRILSVATLAIFMAGCGSHADSTDDPANASPGFVGAWRQFLELDTVSAAGTPVVQRSGPVARRTAQNGPGAETDRVTDQIRDVYSEASSFIAGFPSAEDQYRNLPTKFTAQLDKIRENKGHADAATVARRLTALTAQGNELLERQHTRFSSLATNFNQKLEQATKSATDMEQRCAKIQSAADASQEATQACLKFLDANSMIKAKSELVREGFVRLDQVYQETRKTLLDLANQPGAPEKK